MKSVGSAPTFEMRGRVAPMARGGRSGDGAYTSGPRSIVGRLLRPVLSPQIPVHVRVGFIVFGSSAHRNENMKEDFLGCTARREIMVPAAKKEAGGGKDAVRRRVGARTTPECDGYNAWGATFARGGERDLLNDPQVVLRCSCILASSPLLCLTLDHLAEAIIAGQAHALSKANGEQRYQRTWCSSTSG
jgi:hypothetical protein